MPQQKIMLAEEKLAEIRDFLKENPTVAMAEAQAHFQMGRKLFRRIVKDELNMWAPKSASQNTWPEGTQELIRETLKAKPKTLQSAYDIFLKKYSGERKLSIHAFRFLANKQNLLSEINRDPVRFAAENFSLILKDLTNQPIEKQPDSKTIRRSFFYFLKEVEKQPDLLKLDKKLEFEHKQRYEKIGGKACWACGKTQHFGALIPLDIDHISGQSTNHSLSNLRLLCGCCHHLTTTRGRVYKDEKKTFGLYDNFSNEINLDLMKKEFQNNTKNI